jgi:hypothetical protein
MREHCREDEGGNDEAAQSELTLQIWLKQMEQ